MGSVAAAASVGAAVEVEAAVVASSAAPAEGVTGGVGDSDESELEGAVGVEALCALAVRSIDSEPDARAVGEPLELDQEARLVAVRRHRLAEHHQAAVVDREVLAGLLAGGGGLLRLLQRRLEPVYVLLQACGLVALGADHEQPEGRDHAERRPRERRMVRSVRPSRWRRRRPSRAQTWLSIAPRTPSIPMAAGSDASARGASPAPRCSR